MKMSPTTVDNKYSRLLTSEENLQVFKLLGNRCQSICTTVAQLFCTEPPNHSQWIKKDVGVLCFVKDNSRKNYFFRLFCLRKNMMVWEQEMYKNMEYNDSTLFLHIFEGEDTMIAFNFASNDEAKEFKTVVDEKIVVRKRRDEKRAKVQARTPATQQNTINSQTLREPHDYKKVQDPAVKSAKRRRNITKADIGSPLDFKHISHVGWNPDSGFDIDSKDEQLKCFFEKAGISEKQLQDRDTKEFIYDFINKHGGREAIEESTNRHSSRKAPAIPSFGLAPPVPPVPPRGATRSHVRVAPPPPPVPSSNINSAENDRPIPPPPPLADFGTVPPPPPPAPAFNDMSQQGDSMIPPAPTLGSALLESIKSGTTLKPVEERKMPASPVEDSRGQLLKEIREGTKLKPVCERDVKPVNNVAEPRSGDLAEALARALAERSKAIHSEDDEDDEDDSNDDEWED